MPTGVYDRQKAEPNKGLFIKGQIPWNKDLKGIHLSPDSGFKKGNIPWNKGLIGDKYKEYYKDGFGGIFKKGEHRSRTTEFKQGQSVPWAGKRRPELSGKNHPNWKGGISEYYRNNRNVSEWLKKAKLIRKRDKFICQHCGERGWDVHHIIPRRLTHNDDADNLITLCRLCHRLIESHTKFVEFLCNSN